MLKDELLMLIQAASRAPSPYNTQPWKFSLLDHGIQIHPDFDRKLSVIDPLGRELQISLGCALENAEVTLNHLGFGSEVSIYSHPRAENVLRLEASNAEAKMQN